jgi:hypothetical protein
MDVVCIHKGRSKEQNSHLMCTVSVVSMDEAPTMMARCDTYDGRIRFALASPVPPIQCSRGKGRVGQSEARGNVKSDVATLWPRLRPKT